MSQLFTSCGQSSEALASASVLPIIFRLISFRIYWFDLAVQRRLKSQEAKYVVSVTQLIGRYQRMKPDPAGVSNLIYFPVSLVGNGQTGNI